MMDAKFRTIDGSNAVEILHCCNSIAEALNDEDRKRFAEIRLNCLTAFGFEEGHEFLRQKSVTQLFRDYVPAKLNLIDSGRRDEIDYMIFRSPDEEKVRGEEKESDTNGT
jgi:hypothetical protein